MKLIFCPKCGDIVRLWRDQWLLCSCGQSGGVYLDGINARYAGLAVPIGIDNNSMLVAARAWINDKDKQYSIKAFTSTDKSETFKYASMPVNLKQKETENERAD